VAVCPAVTVAEVEPLLPAPNEKSVPAPPSETVWGLPGALSLTFKVALRKPVAPGVNVRLMVQLPPAVTVVPHVLALMMKSAPFAPATATLVMVTVAALLFVSVTTSGVLVVPTS